MGIRFSCPQCGKSLNVKSELAGRRGICPSCKGRIEIPHVDQGGRWVSNDTAQPTAQAAQAAQPAVQATQPAVPVNQPTAKSNSSTELPELAASPTSRSGPTFAPQAFEDLDPNSFLLDRPSVESEISSPATIDWIADAPDAVWYVRNRAGGQYGPAVGSIMRTWLQEGRVSRECYVWREGWANWRQAIDVFPQWLAPPTSVPYPAPVPTAGGYSSAGNPANATRASGASQQSGGFQNTASAGRAADAGIPVAAVSATPTHSTEKLQPTQSRESSSTWLFLAIVMMILCVSCVGISAIVYIFYPAADESLRDKNKNGVAEEVQIFDPFE